MDVDFLKRWVAALRSGDYAQVRGYLHTPEGFCCLGVACDLIDPDGWDEQQSGEGIASSRKYFPYQNNLFWIPTMLAARIGIYQYFQDKLSSMNDEDKVNFDDIADYIEKELIEKS